MFRKVFMSMVIVLIFSAGQVQADVVHSTWVGGMYGQWETASNWDPAIVPENGANTFTVTINGGTVELTSNHIIDSLDTYDTYGKVNLKRWSLNPVVLTVSNSFTNHGELDTPNTTHLHIYGALINAAGAEIDICSEEIRVYGQEGIRNYGRVYIDADAEFKSEESDVHNFGVLAMNGGVASAEETLINNNGGIIEGYGAAGGRHIINAGLIESIGGTLQIFFETISNTGTLKNSPGASIRTRIEPSNQSNDGMIEVYSDGAVVFDCNLTNEPNGIIKLLGGTLAAPNIVQKAGATFEGQGDISGNLAIDPNGLVKLSGPVNIFGGVQISLNAALEISDGTTLIKENCTCNNGTIRMIGGRVICQGGLTNNNCNIIWEPGAYTNMADFNLDGKVDFKDFTYFGDTWLWQADWY